MFDKIEAVRAKGDRFREGTSIGKGSEYIYTLNSKNKTTEKFFKFMQIWA